MRAILCLRYGPADVLQLVDVKPVPGNNDILVHIHASTVTYGDCELRTLTLPAWTRLPVRLLIGYSKPRHYIPGTEVAGVVEGVGRNVTKYKPGDEVFGSTGMAMGGNAEYTCRPVKMALGLKPAQVRFEDAATIPVGGINALFFLRKANISSGQKVLVIGAGGSIGTWAVLLAKNLYGAEVTAVDHTLKLDMLRSIGADHVIDYTKENFHADGTKYDVIFDTVYKSSFSRCVNALTDKGCYLMANTDPWRMLKGLWLEWTTNKKVKFALAYETEQDLNFLAMLIAEGKIKPVIDRTYPLEETPAAHRYVEQGSKKGSVLIRIHE